MTKPRDQQRIKVFRAERATSQGQEFETIHEARRYVKKLTNSAWFKRRQYFKSDIEVLDGRGTRNAMAYGMSKINIPRWARHERTILHELAHILLACNLSVEAPHGREFCRAMLALVKHQMGKDAYDTLKASYKANKVRYVRTKKTQQSY
jgi:putative metallohydrolase (TIGR04338 family)